MIPILFDMNDPRVIYDSPNVVFRDGIGVLLEPGDEGYTQLQPGEPGYQAPLRPKPPRRPSISVASLNLPTNMQPFRYLIYLIKSVFTAKPQLRDAMSGSDYLDALATRSELTRAQVEKILTEQSALPTAPPGRTS